MNKTAFVLVLFGALGLAILFVTIFVHADIEHRDRILHAETVLAELNEEAWAILYQASGQLLKTRWQGSEVLIDKHELPPPIAALRPYQVRLRKNEVSLQWSRSADVFALYLTALFSEDYGGGPLGNVRTPGIWTIDTRVDDEERLRYQPETLPVQLP